MAFDWSSVLENFGVKTVTRTDKNKGAFVLSDDQKRAIGAAGYQPALGGNPVAAEDELITLNVLFDPTTTSLRVSYYDSIREGAGRTPETRMGRGIIGWSKVGDALVIGNVGSEIYVAKANAVLPVPADAGRELAQKIDHKTIIAKAAKIRGKPVRKDRMVVDFVRNPLIVAGALSRANGSCEMPDCSHQTFSRGDGSVFLEVHHIIPLAERGEDTLLNAAGLCPMCHRELHFGAERLRKRAVLSAHVDKLMKSGRQ